MFKFKGSALGLLTFFVILLKLSCGLSLNRNKTLPLDIEVLNPSEFNIYLAPQENSTLVTFRVNINADLGSSKEADFEKNTTDGDTLRFFNTSLNLKNGDVIHYSGLFENGEGYQGSFIFNGVFKDSKGDTRVGKDSSEEESSEEELDTDTETYPIEARFGHHNRRGRKRHGRRGRGHFHGHGHGHEHWHGHGHTWTYFGPPDRRHDPFGPPDLGPPPFGFPHGHPPFHHGPGLCNGHGHGPNDKFGNNGPWDGHGNEDAGGYGDPFGTTYKPLINNVDNFSGNHGVIVKKPWESGEKGNPNSGSNNNNGLGNNFDNNKPNKGSNTGSNNSNDSFGNNTGLNSVNNSKGSDENDINNGVVSESTSESITTTQRTSTVPKIDIRFPEVDEV